MKIVSRKRYKNADEGVVLVTIQIAVDSDLSAEQRNLRVQHMCSLVTSPRLDPARRRERLRKTAPAAARRRGGGGATVLRQGFAKLKRRRRGVGEGEGCALDMVMLPSLIPSIYRVKGEGDGPSR